MALVVLLTAGCQALMVREVEEPLADTVLMVSRGSDETTLSWQTRRGFRYMVLYADSLSGVARWQALPNATQIVGTGSAVTVKDVVPGIRARVYRLETTPISGRKP